MQTPAPPGRLQRMATGTIERAVKGSAAARRATFGGDDAEEAGAQASGGGGFDTKVAMGLVKEKKTKPRRDRQISRKHRNQLLGAAFILLLLDALLAIVFCLLAPADPRLDAVAASRRQLRTVYLQGFVALLDATISLALVVHVVHGILSASLDNFLEAAAVKLLQATFFSQLQTP